ncbi:MAG: SLBB domain-containing protein [Candidatus Kapaibacterium sp.]
MKKLKTKYRDLRYIKKNRVFILVFVVVHIFVMTGETNAQVDTRVGEFETKKIGQNYFNYSDPEKINIEVIVLGGVKSPGKYLVPEGTTFLDIMSLTGGLINDRIGDNIKFIRPSEKKGNFKDDKVILLKYADLYKDDAVSVIDKVNPVLQPGDIIAVPLKPEMTTWETIKDIMVILTPLFTLGTLVISILNYTK